MISRKRKYFMAITLILVISASYAATRTIATESDDPLVKFKPVTLEIIKTLKRQHFRDQAINDSLSDQLLDSYISRLDPNKNFFYQSDIDEFEQYRTQLDDQLLQGNNSAGFVIYDRFRQRFTQSISLAIELLKNEDVYFDFDLEETLNNDPETMQWIANAGDALIRQRKRIKAFLLDQKLAEVSIDEAREQLTKRYENQLERVSSTSEDTIYELFINSLTELYDPHTSYLSPRSAENFNINMSLSLEGIGAVLSTEDGNTKVVRLVTGGPAQKQGDLRPADLITGVGQEDGEIVDVVGWRLDEVVEKIRGPKGSTVKLRVDSGSPSEANKIIAIKREKVKLEDQAAQKAILDIDYNDKDLRFGVIDIPNFYLDFEAYRQGDPNYRSTTRDVQRLIAELAEENVDGLIIDLRNNGGGSLQEAQALTELFIDKGAIVQIGDGVNNQVIYSRNSPYYNGPLLVMINRLSASASEIFAGAIQDYDRGIVVGSTTFGKGTVQRIWPLKSRGDLKVTDSKFYRVTGESTQHRGVIPDITLPETVDADKVGESSYETALAWSTTNAASYQQYFPIDELLPLVKTKHDQRSKVNPDFIFFNEQEALFEQYSSPKTISLNKKQRILEKENFETQALLIENKRRKAKNQPLFDNYESLKSNNEKIQEERSVNAGTTVIDTKDDALLTEAGYIFGDFISVVMDYYQKESTASR